MREKDSKKTMGGKYITPILMSLVTFVFLCAPFSYTTFQKQEAHALLGGLLGGEIVFDPANFTQNSGLLEKEFLDGIANSLAKHAVQQMTTSIVRWINSGFEGSPAFVTDMEGFLLDVADQAAGEFFAKNNLNGLCTPFQFSVSAAIELQYYQSSSRERYACTLSDALQTAMNDVGSVSNAMNGWEDWLAVTTVPQNNQYGQMLLQQQGLDEKVANAEENAKREVDQGNGFLSFKVCTEVQGGEPDCHVATPSSVISEQINKALGAGQDTLISSDEINEVVSALFAQLAQQAITGIGGLSGLSQSGSGSSSYLNRLETNNDGDNERIGLTNSSDNPIGDTLASEYEARALYQDILAEISRTEQEAIADKCSPTLSRDLMDERAEIQTLASNTSGNIAQLELLSSQYVNASSGATENNVYQQFLALRNQADLHTQFDLINLEFELDAVQTESNQFLRSCN